MVVVWCLPKISVDYIGISAEQELVAGLVVINEVVLIWGCSSGVVLVVFTEDSAKVLGSFFEVSGDWEHFGLETAISGRIKEIVERSVVVMTTLEVTVSEVLGKRSEEKREEKKKEEVKAWSA